jgi:hypothetical protein
MRYPAQRGGHGAGYNNRCIEAGIEGVEGARFAGPELALLMPPAIKRLVTEVES